MAEIVGGKLYGDSTVEIDDVRSAESAGPSHITFARGIYAEHIEEMKAGVILVDELPAHYTKNLIVVPDCRRSFGQLVDLYHPESHYTPGIHPTAVVSDKAVIGKDVCIMPYAVIDEGARIGDGTVIFPYTYVGKNAQIGKDCEINPGCVIHENSVLGDRVVLRAHAVVGGQGFGFSTDEKGHHHHIRQLGKAVISDDCELGAGTAVDNGALNDTVVGRGTKIDNLVHLGHNVQVGEADISQAEESFAENHEEWDNEWQSRIDQKQKQMAAVKKEIMEDIEKEAARLASEKNLDMIFSKYKANISADDVTGDLAGRIVNIQK